MDYSTKYNNYQTLNHDSPKIYNAIMNSIPDNYQKSTINDSYQNNIYNVLNTYNNFSTSKILNNNNNKKEQSKDEVKLNFRIIESTTEDLEHPLMELKKGLKGRGWQSSRFSQFPQDIYIQFPQPVIIKRIDIITHEKKIPSQIKFFTYCPKNNDEFVKNIHQVNYNYIGFIKMDTNERYNFVTRESRKVYINSKSLFLKIQLDKNYINQYNIFNQVGLMHIDFFGDYMPLLGGKNRNNNLIIQNSLRKDNIRDEDLKIICGDKLDKLKELMNQNIKTENYEECKQLKSKIEKIRLYGRKIYDLESQKKIAVNNEDFDKAMELRDLVEKMKNNLELMDNDKTSKFNNSDLFDINSQIVGNNNMNNMNNLNNLNNLNNISLVPNYGNNTINDSGIINESINDNLISQFDQSNSNNIKFNTNNNSIQKKQETIINHDDMVLPAVLKRINNEPENNQDEYGSVEKGELEQISPKLLKDFNLICNVIKEEGMRKLFSKQILWKEEGLNDLIKNIANILEYKDENDKNIINKIITQIMKLSMILIEDKHPSIIIKTLEVLKKLFEFLKEHHTKLNVEANTTDSILFRIKQRLGDVNPKVRAKAVSLYCYMLTLNFCDYDNLISELLEEELRHYDSKFVPKSNNLIMGKLDIFINVFNNFSDALNSKRTKIETFPSNLVIDYLIMNVSHNKSEIRKKTRLAISLFIRYFGVPKYKKKLEKIEERELIKLVSEIPELREHYPKLYSPSSGDLSNSGNDLNVSNKGMKKSKSIAKINNLYNYSEKDKKNPQKTKRNKSNNNNDTLEYEGLDLNKDEKNNIKNDDEKSDNNEINNNKNNNNIKNNNNKEKKKGKSTNNNYCEYCRSKMKDGEILVNHWITSCKMFTQCEKCFMNLEVQKLNEHRANDCKFKDHFKLCKVCNESFLKEEFYIHQKEKCSLKKGYKKCPLCHKDVDIINKNGFYYHLVKQKCKQQNRND